MNHRILNYKKDIILSIAIAILTFIILLVFSVSTSPLYDNISFDQNIFNTIGRGWAHGKLPYRDLWDSKGPIIFFYNMLGFKLTDSIRGVFIIQYIHHFIAFLIAFIMLRKFFKSVTAFFVVTLMILSYATICCGGNEVAEYNLIVSIPATILAYKWSRKWNAGTPDHPWQYAFVYGLYFCAGLLSRATNAIPVIVWTAFIFFVLVYNKLWHNIMANIIGFLAGFAVIFLPFAIYFGAHGALGDMWYAAISYNIEYALNSAKEVSTMDHYFLYFTTWFICVISVALYSFVLIFTDKNSRKFGIMWLLVACATITWLYNSFVFNMYALAYLPMLFIPIIDWYTQEKNKIFAKAITFLSIAIIIIGFVNNIRIYRNFVVTYDSDEELQAEIKLIRKIPNGSKMVTYNVETYPYLIKDMYPCYNYFVCQDWAIKCGPSLKQKVIKKYSSLKAEWIIASKTEGSAIEDILKKNYKVIETANYHDPETNKTVYIKLFHLK